MAPPRSRKSTENSDFQMPDNFMPFVYDIGTKGSQFVLEAVVKIYNELSDETIDIDDVSQLEIMISSIGLFDHTKSKEFITYRQENDMVMCKKTDSTEKAKKCRNVCMLNSQYCRLHSEPKATKSSVGVTKATKIDTSNTAYIDKKGSYIYDVMGSNSNAKILLHVASPESGKGEVTYIGKMDKFGEELLSGDVIKIKRL
jgi:hypothetical protein